MVTLTHVISAIDTHTAGEPTRIVLSGVPPIPGSTMLEKKQFMAAHHMLIEGSAAVAIAAFLKVQEAYRHKNVVILLCGANISLDVLEEVLSTP